MRAYAKEKTTRLMVASEKIYIYYVAYFFFFFTSIHLDLFSIWNISKARANLFQYLNKLQESKGNYIQGMI